MMKIIVNGDKGKQLVILEENGLSILASKEIYYSEMGNWIVAQNRESGSGGGVIIYSKSMEKMGELGDITPMSSAGFYKVQTNDGQTGLVNAEMKVMVEPREGRNIKKILSMRYVVVNDIDSNEIAAFNEDIGCSTRFVEPRFTHPNVYVGMGKNLLIDLIENKIVAEDFMNVEEFGDYLIITRANEAGDAGKEYGESIFQTKRQKNNVAETILYSKVEKKNTKVYKGIWKFGGNKNILYMRECERDICGDSGSELKLIWMDKNFRQIKETSCGEIISMMVGEKYIYYTKADSTLSYFDGVEIRELSNDLKNNSITECAGGLIAVRAGSEGENKYFDATEAIEDEEMYGYVRTAISANWEYFKNYEKKKSIIISKTIKKRIKIDGLYTERRNWEYYQMEYFKVEGSNDWCEIDKNGEVKLMVDKVLKRWNENNYLMHTNEINILVRNGERIEVEYTPISSVTEEGAYIKPVDSKKHEYFIYKNGRMERYEEPKTLKDLKKIKEWFEKNK